MAAITGLVMVSAIGGAIDLSRQLSMDGRLQDVMDQAVLAGAKAGSANAVSVATKSFSAYAEPGVTLSTPQFSVASDGSVSGSVTGSIATYLLAAANINTLSSTVNATAASPTSYLSMGSVCVLLKDTSAQGITQNGGANVSASGCALAVQSTANPAAMFNSGSTLNFSNICVAGSNVTSNGGAPANLTKSCNTVSGKSVTDPYAGNLPTPSYSGCTYNSMNYNGGSVTFTPTSTTTPVVFCGSFNLNGAPTVTFKPGIYVFSSSTWNVSGGTWTGNGVTFYFADSSSKLQFNSGINATLSAPTSGTYQGILFYEPTGLAKTAWTFDDSAGDNLSGLMYLPSRQMTFNFGSNTNGDALSMVFDTLILDQTNWTLKNATTQVPKASGGGSSVYLKS